MPDKNGKKYQWEKKLTASFNFDGALEVAAAAAALAQGREDLVSGSDGDLPSWYRDQRKPAAMEMPRPSPFIGPRTNRKPRRFAISWESPKTAKTNRETRSEFLWNIPISSKSPASWKKPLWRSWAGEERSRNEGNQTVAVLRRISLENKNRKSFKNVLHHPHRDRVSEFQGPAAGDPGTHLGANTQRSAEKRVRPTRCCPRPLISILPNTRWIPLH